jgi:hypothetical protein
VISKLRFWIPLAIAITGICGLVYAAVQQDLRQSANDPQIQIAEDAASKLTLGQGAESVVPQETVEISKSLAPYVIVFSDSGGIVASSAQLDGAMPTVPAGVFDYVRKYGEERFTWQPREEVRSAVVLTKYSGSTGSGFVLAGRSLREVEIREARLEIMVGLAWIAAMVATFVATLVLIPNPRKK